MRKWVAISWPWSKQALQWLHLLWWNQLQRKEGKLPDEWHWADWKLASRGEFIWINSKRCGAHV